MDKLRLRFEKTGRSVYISHLDLMHTMQRAFSRAGYELKYSEGFNPHPQISIALPLSVGASSYCEIMDFKLKTDTDIKLLPEKLNSVLPEGLNVIECYEPAFKVSELKFIEISGVFEYDVRNLTDMEDSLTDFFSADEIIISKKTKRGVSYTDIKKGIRSLSFEAKDGFINIKAIISAQGPTLNPELLVSALRQQSPRLEPDFAKFARLETYFSDMRVYR